MNTTSAYDSDEQSEKFNQDKKWLFEENMRLSRIREELEEERKLFDIQKELIIKQKNKNTFIQGQLTAEKMLFDRRLEEIEILRLELENKKKQLLDDEQKLKKLINEQQHCIDAMGTDAQPKMFFIGIRNGADLRKRYKELTKIYHPDNSCGSAEVIAAINDEYELLKKYYIGM